MMIPSPRQPHCLSGIVVTLYFFLLFSYVLPTLASPKLHYCSHDQRDALMEFKHEFPENESNPRFNNLTSWNKSSDCCSWEGVTCDAKSGKVISLFVFAVFLNNSLKQNSGLFKLLYLQNLTLLVCNLHGEIPSSFGNLSHLKYLNLQGNKLRGQIPASIGNLTQLRDLGLRENMLSGKIPVSFANLTQLRYLDLSMNQLSGKIPVSFFNLTELFELHLQSNDFEPQLLPDMGRLHNLMGFSGNSFFGPFPRSLFTIPSLEFVELRGNQFKGPIDFGNISLSYRLQILSLADNKLDGPIPESISKFLNLETLDLRNNSFFGPFPTLLLTIPSLQIVKLAGNQFKGPIDFGSTSSSSSSNLRVLDLAHNQFDGQISESISKYLNLVVLDLSNNKLEGEVPCCIRRLESLILSHNSFNSFGKSSEVLDQTQLRELRLDSNSFRGPFPLWICELISLEFLDFSDNTFSGSVPSCLRSTTKYLQVLNLRNNNFSGILPDVFVNATFLSELDISHNRLEGKLPKSLINCIWLGILNVGSNKFKDKFPSWLGSLPSLNVIILRSNQLYGPLYHRNVPIGFQSLKVIDVSHNYFSGTFPTFYFSSWLEMSQMTTVIPEYGDAYMSYYIDMTFGNFDKGSGAYSSSMEIVHKGVDTEFEKIRKDFRAIDFSRNRFYGKIPESIGLLKGLRFLNLSSNAFTRNIPHSLANLTNLEALDVSHNQLSCQIPQDLGELSFLSTMNFAHNNLEGPIPRSTQFQRQNCSSFMDNPKLYGLDDICRKTHVPNPTPQKLEEEQMINWIAMAIAYGPGVFCGLVIGHIFISHKHEWFMERFRRNNPRVVIRSAR